MYLTPYTNELSIPPESLNRSFSTRLDLTVSRTDNSPLPVTIAPAVLTGNILYFADIPFSRLLSYFFLLIEVVQST